MVSVSASSASSTSNIRIVASSIESETTSSSPSAIPITSPSWMGFPCTSFESLIARVTSPVLTSSRASVIASTFSSSEAVSSNANIAENASGTLLVGTTAQGLSETSEQD